MITPQDVKELKDRYKGHAENSVLTTIKAVHVSSEAEILGTYEEDFKKLDEDKQFRYLDLLQSIYQNKRVDDRVLTLALEDENIVELLRMNRDSKLEDTSGLFRHIIANYETLSSYVIIAFHDIYDVVKKAKDGMTMDESEETYEHIIVLICPITVQPPALYCEENTLEKITRRDVIGAPASAFIWPAFDNRSADDNELMWFTRNEQNPEHELMESFGTKRTLTATEHRDLFEHSVEKAADYSESKTTYLENINAVFEALLLDESVNYKTPKKHLTAEDMETQLSKAKIPEFVVDRVVEDYRARYRKEFPKLEWIFSRKYKNGYYKRMKLQRAKDLLTISSDWMKQTGQLDVANEIDAFLQKGR